ncbi:MAG: RNA polymerase sigma factor [Evtepia sp.]|uniref:RNA polymerase sigma factor n=1 Tax=Evtepia sp. TaxID=2773933 RepID=UPI002A755FDE|nr:RNA polymerase sigma factor [Evtepia sp.]MDY3014414.1 RNA polymerase sigma factor [Evtepia sp.]
MLPVLLAALDTPEEKEAFTKFYLDHKVWLYRCALTYLHSPALAEEAAQEAWMRCVLHAETFFPLPLREKTAWLFVVVKNICLNTLKKETRYSTLAPTWDTPVRDPGSPGDIVSLIRAMPEQYRTVLELKFVLEWKDKEIARFLHLSETAVSSRVSRGRKLLQQVLREEGYTP